MLYIIQDAPKKIKAILFLEHVTFDFQDVRNLTLH